MGVDTRRLTIVHLYAREMNVYGDHGNIRTLVRRLAWRGFDAVVRQVGVGEDGGLSDADLVFVGGGQDRGQLLVGRDLLHGRAEELHRLCRQDVPMLVVCGGYQLFGRRFVTADGVQIPGIGLFDAETRAGPRRMVGNLVVDSPFGRLVGFENHSGQTVLDPGQQPLGRVVRGRGNNGRDRTEGARRRNVFGTYLHGPLLPKNPVLADRLIAAALARHGVTELAPLDDTLELRAAAVAARRPR